MNWHTSLDVGTFVGALGVVFLLLVFELVVLTAGLSVSQAVDALVDSASLPDHAMLNWLFRKEVPFQVSLVSALTAYGGVGLLTQALANAIYGHPLPLLYALPGAILMALEAPALVEKVFKRIGLTPSRAHPADSFVGQEAVMHDDAERDASGLALLKDSTGYVHMLQVEPELEADTLKAGDRVRITKKVHIALHFAQRI